MAQKLNAAINNHLIQHVLVSRVDAIGDVMLTLPVCGYLKVLFPVIKVSFLGRNYTKAVVECCESVDDFINYDELRLLNNNEQVSFLSDNKIDAVVHVFPDQHIAELAKKAGIPIRIGTTNRLYHWFTCNQLVKLSRKNSVLHEAQLNIKLLKPLGMYYIPALADIITKYNFKAKTGLPAEIKNALTPGKFNLILHPKSHGSGAEWDLNKFNSLVDLLPKDKFNIIVTGSDKEKEFLKPWLAEKKSIVIDMTGKMTLDILISFIGKADGLVAAGTGPVHIAAASGIFTLGLFPCVRPIYPGRWAPIGKKAAYIESNGADLSSITANDVYERIMNWIK